MANIYYALDPVLVTFLALPQSSQTPGADAIIPILLKRQTDQQTTKNRLRKIK